MAEPYFTFDERLHPICEVGMSTTRQAEPTSWLDVSCYVHQAELFRGRERFNERFEPGTASVTFSNSTGWADLGGTYVEVAAAELRPGRPLRIGITGPFGGGADITRWLYRGWIDQATPAYDPVLHDVVTVNCIDALGESGSSTAPTGDHQGVNETVSARLNRVLDAVGWWGTKRKIAATATTVQGTQLGAAAIDHMSQAADSAGGVVFGDLDGDVVFKDIDWMLYDPDTPPDDTIGNGPGGGGPGAPPYIDPVAGPVYDPDDPPAANPPKVCVCADGTAGTLVEKGDNYRLYVKDGHLFYESSGSTWDMGPYSGGCTCVEPPHDGEPPERSDDPDGDGEYDPSDVPPEFLDPLFGVELLAWNDGGLSDPPAASVTVAGVTPGHDCLLVALITGLGALTDTAGLDPTVTGGGLDWSHSRGVDRPGGIASSWIVLTQVGRTDPGTFSVVVTWTAPSTSRSHIVTVWKVTAAVDDYLERFDAGAVLYGIATSAPPEFIQPGDGPVTVDLAAYRQPAGLESLTRTVDITIAQSLAEEGSAPFGATFADSPPWIYPANTPPLVVPVLLDGEWVDDFERADGTLGANWVLGPGPGYADELHPLAIDDGAAVASVFNPSAGAYKACAMHWHEAQGTNQAIEIELDPAEYCYLFTQANDTDYACQFCDFQFGVAGNITISLYHFLADGSTTAGEAESVAWAGAPGPVRLRLESDADGTQRVYVDDVLALTWVDPSPVTGPYVGMGIDQRDDRPIARILRASGASLGAARKTSWVAGWRPGVASATVNFSDVNFGPTDIQSAQACLVLESAETETGWRLLDYDLNGEADGVTPAGTLVMDNQPRPGSFLVVMVGATASTDIIDSVTVTGADLTLSHVQHKTGASWGQGAIFTGRAPLDFDPASWTLVVTHPGVEAISAVVYEVADADTVAPVGGVASGVLGTTTAGSVNGSSTITMSEAGDAAGVALAFIHVAADPSASSGATSADGDEWHEEFEYSSAINTGYFQTMSRAPGQPESTSTSVHWDDVQTGTAATYSGVQLAVEIRPAPDPFNPTPGGAGVALGGINDPWNGIIHTASATFGGETFWEFP